MNLHDVKDCRAGILADRAEGDGMTSHDTDDMFGLKGSEKEWRGGGGARIE